MAVRALDHVNICTPDVAGTARFFVEVLGMRVTAPGGDRPLDLAQAAWICDDADRPIIHLVSRARMGGMAGSDGDGSGSGRIHHVALACSDPDAVTARLAERGIASQDIAAGGRRLLFVEEPNGIRLELNFPDG